MKPRERSGLLGNNPPALYRWHQVPQLDQIWSMPNRFPRFFRWEESGQYTYSTGRSAVCLYLMLDLRERGRETCAALCQASEQLVIDTLAEFGVNGERTRGRIWGLG